MIRAARQDHTQFVIGASAALLAAGVASSLLAPGAFWALLATVALVALLGLAWAFPVQASLGWFVLVATTPEMWLGELTGQDSLILAGVKLVGLQLAAICVLRYGFAADLLNPGLAFLVMFAASLVHGRDPNLQMDESLRSLIGSIAPFAFCFSRLSWPWAQAIIRATRWLPPVLVAGGAVLQAAGLRPLFVDYEGLRLEATGHPAFLGGFALAAIEAGLLELLREGRRIEIGLIGLNAAILVLSGARAPLLMAALVSAAAVLLVPSPALPLRRRLVLILSALCLVPPLLAVAGSLGDIRLFGMLAGEATGLSNRDLLWPWFEQAWNASPWVGWGVGAAKTVMPAHPDLVKLIGTTAAHNEYLRIGVEGGWFGLLLLIGLFVAWTIVHTSRMNPPDRILMRVVMLAFAAHAYTDNVLIATTSSVLFTWVSAAFAHGAIERAQDAAAQSPIP